MTLFPKNRPEAHGAAALLLTLLFSFPSISQTSFGPLVELDRSYTGIEERDYITAAFGDYNNDGFLDIAATTYHEVIVYRNNPQRPGSFTVAFRHPLGDMGRQICWADFDNDGDLDLFVNFSWTNETMFFRNSGAAGNLACADHRDVAARSLARPDIAYRH